MFVNINYCCCCCCRFVAGVIRLERLHRFEQVLWRACHGNVFMRHAEIDERLEDPTTVSFKITHILLLACMYIPIVVLIVC